MGRETVLFKSEEKCSRADAAAFLRNLADKLETGRLVLQQAGAETILEPPEMLVLEVKAEEELKGQSQEPHYSLEVELAWRPGDESKARGVSLG